MTEVQVFRRSRFDRFKLAAFAVLLVILGPIFGLMLLITLPSMRLPTALFAGFLFIPLIAFAPISVIWQGRACIRLSEEWVEWNYLFKTHRLRREEIAAWRVPQMASVIQLLLKSGKLASIPYKDLDGAYLALEQWLEGLPDLKAIADAEEEARLTSNMAFGATLEERQKRLSGHKAFVIVMSCVSLCLSVVGALAAQTWVCLTLLVIPLVVYILPFMSQGRWSLVTFAGEKKLALGHIAAWPMFAVGLAAYEVFEPVNEAPLLMWAVCLAVGLFFGAGLFKPHWELVWNVPALLAYSFAILTFANGLSQAVASEKYEAVITDKTNSLKRPYRVTIAPWGPMPYDRTLPVGSDAWRKVEEGDALCMTLYTGALGWQYYDYALCEPKAPPAVP